MIKTLNYKGGTTMNGATPLSMLPQVYGKNVLVSQVNGYNIIHMDDPTEEQIKQRIKEILDEQINKEFEIDCPLCRSMKHEPYDIVYFKQ
jgi:hypothetical protein